MIPLNAEAGDASAGAKLFKQNCARCHGQEAKGDGPDLIKLQAATSPDGWTDKSVNQSLTDTFIISMITKGGKANGKSPIMPSFAGKLNADQMQDLLAFLRSVAH
jgi:mono/diheme cytochrome c family protein